MVLTEGVIFVCRFLCWWKMAMMAVWAAVLMTYGASIGIAKVVYKLGGGLLKCACCVLMSVGKIITG